MGQPSARRHGSKRTLVAGALLFVASGCRSILGVDGYGTVQAEAGAPETFVGTCDRTAYASETCRDCIDHACCDEATACATEPACVALSACLAKCRADDAACRVTCNLSTRRTTEMSNLMACAATSCSTCAEAHATLGGLACQTCLEREDPDDLATLSSTVAALELESCRGDCPPGYESNCTCDDYVTDGNPVLTALHAVPLCIDDCGTPDWSCLGSVQWPRLADVAPPLVLHVGLADVISQQQPLSTPTVYDCAAIDLGCAQPLETATWDAATQSALLTLMRNGTGGAGTDYFGALLVSWPDPSRPDPSNVLLSFLPSIRRSPAWTWRRLVSRKAAESIAAGAGITDALEWDQNGGIVWSLAACNNVAAAGVTASLDSGERAYFLDIHQALSTELTETTTTALGAFINVTPGPRTLTLRLAAGNRKLGTYKFNVRQGAVTTLSLTPAPDSE